MDTQTRNHIEGWSLIKAGMSGEAFSTALRHAALLDLGDSSAVGGTAIYDLCGRPIDASAEDADAQTALVIEVSRRKA